MPFRTDRLQWFIVVFLAFPVCSARTFEFFLIESFDKPGELQSHVMLNDRSVDTSFAEYKIFRVYAFVCVGIYPVGTCYRE